LVGNIPPRRTVSTFVTIAGHTCFYAQVRTDTHTHTHTHTETQREMTENFTDHNTTITLIVIDVNISETT